MMRSRLSERIFGWLGGKFTSGHSAAVRVRGPQSHVIILDGTMSTLERGKETHAGMTYRLCQEMGTDVSVYYEAGVQWPNWAETLNVMMGRGINRQIRRAYGYLASRYRPGDTIFLIGYSRGAYAVRSLAGVIDRVGLVTAEHATERAIKTAYRYYECNPDSPNARVFRENFCHAAVEIQMVGVWDTVKALGLRLPILWRFTEARHSFHNHQLSDIVRHGFHALAMDETREVFDPVLWQCPDSWPGRRAEQVWFPGTHGDVGGQLSGFEEARPLANISLVWMLKKAEACGLPLPGGWADRFVCDPHAPSVSTWRSWGKIFLLRKKRRIGADVSERLHDSVAQRPAPVDFGASLSRVAWPLAWLSRRTKI